jgi:hypothetical protein
MVTVPMADGCRNSEDCLVFGQPAWKLTMISKPITGRSPGIRHGTAGKSPVKRGRQEIAVLINYH